MPRDIIIGAIETLGAYSAVVASESVPTLITDGIPCRDGTAEVNWWFSGGSTATYTVSFFGWDNLAAAWCKDGTPIDVTGSEILQQYTYGQYSRVAARVSALVNGPLVRNAQHVEKDA